MPCLIIVARNFHLQMTVQLLFNIGLSWAAFEKNKSLLTSSCNAYKSKTKIYNYILPVLLYGLDCVNWTITRLKKVKMFQNHIMRFMTNNRL